MGRKGRAPSKADTLKVIEAGGLPPATAFVERVDSSAPGLYLCDPSDGQAVALYTEADARQLLLTSAAMFRLRDARGGWTPWPA